MRRGTKATWQSPGGPHGAHGAHGAHEAHIGAAMWQEATRSRGPRGRPCGAPRGRLVSGGPTGIVGPGYMFGVVTQYAFTAP